MRTEREFLVDVLGCLSAAAVEYMLTGSMASNYWGIPRTTHDLDIVVLLDPDRVDPLVEAFASGFFVQRSAVSRAFWPPHQFNVLDERSALKADFWQLRDDAFEREMFQRKLSVPLFGAVCQIATAEDVLLHKLYWNRLSPSDRQLGDAAGIYSVQRAQLDHAYLLRWAETLGVTRELDDLHTGRLRPKRT